jgi:hypothetical protein
LGYQLNKGWKLFPSPYKKIKKIAPFHRRGEGWGKGEVAGRSRGSYRAKDQTALHGGDHLWPGSETKKSAVGVSAVKRRANGTLRS